MVFLVLESLEAEKMRGLQTFNPHCEKFLAQFGRANVPRIYLIDGDFAPGIAPCFSIGSKADQSFAF